MSIQVIDKIKPLGNFPIADTRDIDFEGARLDVVLNASAVELGKKANKDYVDEQIANIPKVTKTSEIENDSGFITQHSLSEYVKVTDSRLSDARPASDVSPWAKSATKPTYNKSEIGLSNVDNTSDNDKPISIATQTALNDKASRAELSAVSSAIANKAESSTVSAISAELNGKAETSFVNTLDIKVENIETAQDVLSARMDAIESGTTPEGSEVIGIRTGADGTEYDNAGTAVRTQFDNVNANMSEGFNSRYAEYFPKAYNGRIDTTNGHISISSAVKDRLVTMYIDKGKYNKIKFDNTKYGFYLFYYTSKSDEGYVKSVAVNWSSGNVNYNEFPIEDYPYIALLIKKKDNTNFDNLKCEISIIKSEDIRPIMTDDMLAYALGNVRKSAVIVSTTHNGANSSFNTVTGKVDINTSANWIYADCTVDHSKMYYVEFRKASNADINDYIIFADDNDNVVGTASHGSADLLDTFSFVNVPMTAKKIYVKSFRYFEPRIYAVNKFYGLQEQINDKSDADIFFSALGDIPVEGTTSGVLTKGARIDRDIYGELYANNLSYWNYIKLTVTPKEIYKISINKAGNANSADYVMFADENNKFMFSISHGIPTENVSHEFIKIPDGAAFAYVMSYSSYNPSCVKVSSIKTVRDMINDISADIPEYYAEYLSEKKTAIDAVMNAVNTGDAFVFITDNHLQANTLNSFGCIETILNGTSIDKVFYNGDAIAAYGSESDIDTYAKMNRDKFKALGRFGKVFMGKGNHDFMIIDENTNEYLVKDTKYAYNMLTKINEGYSEVSQGKCYYYYDNKNQKIRYINIDTQESVSSAGINAGLTDAQYDWLVNTALNVPAGYHVAVIGHIPVDSKMRSYHERLAEVHAILSAFKNKTNHPRKDFTGSNGTLIAYFCGHNHVDSSFVTNGVLSISTTSDAYYSDGGYSRTRGTTNEVAFDVFTVDTTAKTINAIRIGAGDNRSWTY